MNSPTDTLATPAPVLAGGLQAEVFHGGVGIIDRLRAEWLALCEESALDQPFYRPEWFGAYVRAFAADRKLVIATVRHKDRLITVLPLILEWGLLEEIPAFKLRAAGNAHTCRYDLIVRREWLDLAIPVLWNALLRIPGWDVLELTNVPNGAALTHLAHYARSQGCEAHLMRSITSPYLTLGAGERRPETAFGRIDRKFQANLRRRLRKLEAKGPVRLTRTSTFDAALDRFYVLERAGWKGAAKSAITCDAATRRFYSEVAGEATRLGHLSLYALECAGKPVAMHYGLEHAGRYFLLKTAYDEAFGECSPGQLLTHEVLRDLQARGFVEFDFLGPLMSWKADWAPSLRAHADWHVFRGPLGRLVHSLRFRARPAIGRLARRWR